MCYNTIKGSSLSYLSELHFPAVSALRQTRAYSNSKASTTKPMAFTLSHTLAPTSGTISPNTSGTMLLSLFQKQTQDSSLFRVFQLSNTVLHTITSISLYSIFYSVPKGVPKGVQEKRTDVLKKIKLTGCEWVMHFFWMNTCEVIHQWREKAVLLFVPEKFDFQCDLWQNVEHYTLQQAHITVLLIMQLPVKTQLI